MQFLGRSHALFWLISPALPACKISIVFVSEMTGFTVHQRGYACKAFLNKKMGFLWITPCNYLGKELALELKCFEELFPLVVAQLVRRAHEHQGPLPVYDGRLGAVELRRLGQ